MISMGPLVEGIGVNFTGWSYAGEMAVAVMACGEQSPTSGISRPRCAPASTNSRRILVGLIGFGSRRARRRPAVVQRRDLRPSPSPARRAMIERDAPAREEGSRPGATHVGDGLAVPGRRDSELASAHRRARRARPGRRSRVRLREGPRPSANGCRSSRNSPGSSRPYRSASTGRTGSTTRTFDLRRHFHRMTVPRPGGPARPRRRSRRSSAASSTVATRSGRCGTSTASLNGRVAVLIKMHHSVLDGGAGSVLATLLFDLERAPGAADTTTRRRADPESPPSDWSLVVGRSGVGDRRAVAAGSLSGQLARPQRRSRRPRRAGRDHPDVGTRCCRPRRPRSTRPSAHVDALAFSSVASADVKAVAGSST